MKTSIMSTYSTLPTDVYWVLWVFWVLWVYDEYKYQQWEYDIHCDCVTVGIVTIIVRKRVAE